MDKVISCYISINCILHVCKTKIAWQYKSPIFRKKVHPIIPVYKISLLFFSLNLSITKSVLRLKWQHRLRLQLRPYMPVGWPWVIKAHPGILNLWL